MLNTFWTRANKNNLTWWCVLKTSWRHLCRRVEDVFARHLENFLKMSSEDVWLRRIFHLDRDILKRSSEDKDERHLQDVFIKTNVCWVTAMKVSTYAFHYCLFNNTHKEKLHFTQISTRMAAWVLLAFFICLHNQLSSIHFIVTC